MAGAAARTAAPANASRPAWPDTSGMQGGFAMARCHKKGQLSHDGCPKAYSKVKFIACMS